MSHDQADRTGSSADKRTSLAVQRTTMAANRSLMAWVRTGLALVGFGFTAYKIIEAMGDLVEPQTARNVGLILIAWGTLSIFFGIIEYWQTIREIRSEHNIEIRRFPQFFAGGFILFGIVVFLAVILRVV